MSVVSPSTAPVVGASGSGTSKKKRTRSRRTRKRTSDVIEEDDESSSSSDEEKGEQSVKAQGDSTKPMEEKEPVIEQDSKTPADDGEKREKRKRKRTRGKSKKEEEEKPVEEGEAKSNEHDADKQTNNQITAKANVEEKKIPSAAPSASLLAYLDNLGSPQSQSGLNEKTINALSYARQYHIDRTNWKFNKAKQEYLIRHMLTPPPISTQSTASGEEAAANNEDDDETGNATDQHWPDQWNRCVARYLVTIQGKAKQRMIDTLTEAAHREVPTIAQGPEGDSTEPSTAATPISTPAVKSVSFGDMAMQQDADGVGANDTTSGLSAAEVERIRFEKERAEKMLYELQE